MKYYLLHKLAVVACCAIPFLNNAQTPNLGRASTFTLFTSAGAFTNIGNTHITGDIGTHVGTLSGFPPGTITGSVHVADSVTAQVASNLATAYGAMSTLTCDSTIGATMGSGQLLKPKIYCITTLATLSGNLILDAQGDSNAFFVFKINGAFSTGSLASITLINSAALKNVFWQINGAFTLGANSVFKGTVLANGAISLLSNASLVGRGLTTAGAISLSTNTSSLPVKFQSFHTSCKGTQIEIVWSTVSETNNQYFNLETSTDKLNWNSLAKINGAGNTSVIKTYSYLHDYTQPEYTFYRLQQVDFDGNSTYSDIVKQEACIDPIKEAITLYPNPVNGFTNVSYEGNHQTIKSVSVYNSSGALAYYAEGFPASIDLSDKPEGVYFVQIQFESEIIVRKLFVKNN